MKKLLRCVFYSIVCLFPVHLPAQNFSSLTTSAPTTRNWAVAANVNLAIEDSWATSFISAITSSASTLPALNTTYGTPSASQLFQVSGTGLVAGILVTPSAGFEVSTDNMAFSSTVTLGGAGIPALSNVRVYTRLSATDVAASYSGNVVLSSAAAINVTVAITSSAVSKAPLTITAVDQSKIYGGANPTLTASYSGFLNGDTQAVLTSLPALSTTATAASPVNTYPITASGASSANYTFNYAAGTLTVTRATLTITADNQTKVYGTANPLFSAIYVGFVNGDTQASLTSPPQITTIATKTSPTGIYPITISGAVSPNYTINYTGGTLTIIANSLNITVVNASKVYGAANPVFTVTYTGFVNGDNQAGLTTQPIVATTATVASAVNNYLITASGAASPNYTITYTPGTLTVTPATLTVTPNTTARNYGAANPVISVSYSGFANGDTNASLTTQPTVTTIANAASPVSSYPTTAGGAAAANYIFTYTAGLLNVLPVPLTITANNASRTYGLANPAFTVSYSGFVNGDTNTSLTTPPVITSKATLYSLPGTYAITAGGAAAANYTVNYAPGILTVIPLTNANLNNLTVSIGLLAPFFATAITAYTVNVPNAIAAISLTPTVQDTTATVKINGVAVNSASASANIPLVVGANIINTVVTAQDGKTTITYVVTVIRTKPPAITALGILPPLTAVYGSVSSSAAFTVSGLYMIAGILITPPGGFEISTDNITFSNILTVGGAGTIAPVLIYTRLIAGTPAGVYSGGIVLTGNGAANDTLTVGTGTISVAQLTIIADNKTRGIDEPNPFLTATYVGFVNGDLAAQLTTQPEITTTATTTSPAGQYPVTASGAVSANYKITYMPGVLTVTPVALINSFTPNGDGINDTWNIKNIENYPNCIVDVFNRSGARVFHSVNYPVAWDGKYNGTYLQTGTYYYVINLNNGSKPLSGWVTILR